jgi:hypothetical protein
MELKRLLSFNVVTFLLLLFVGDLAVLFLGPPALDLIHSNTGMPDFAICFIVVIMTSLEANHTIFSTIITTKNEVPFVKASLLSGGIIGLLTFILLKYTSLGLWAVVLPQLIVQLCYNNWRWPLYVMNDLNLSVHNMIYTGNAELFNKIKHIVCRK